MSYKTAYDRWSGVGPYYAMFPLGFVNKVVKDFTRVGQRILDPFAGRASSVFAGAANGRPSIGIEINPVGWIYGNTKLAPATAENVEARIDEVIQIAQNLPANTGNDLSEFFRVCFAETSLRFLIAARNSLDWKHMKIDRTLMALILIDLHGVRERSFSNQMRQSKAMSPEYSVKWWLEQRLIPPQINPKEFLEKKIRWRYAKGITKTAKSSVWLGDSCHLLKRVQNQIIKKNQRRFKLLITSPPYLGISDYHRDQWLRLWMLGSEPDYRRIEGKHKRDFASQTNYKNLLSSVFLQSSEMMSKSGYVYVRTDAREQTFEITHEVLKTAFPRWKEKIIYRPYSKDTQTALYGDKSKKPGEKDIILQGPRA
jgi:hypothetical protein